MNKEYISIYPNPSNEYFSVSGFDNSAFVRLTNQNGSTVLSKKVNKNEHINLCNFPPGIYLVSIETGDNLVLHKLIKTN
ncbi:MAG: T9SS type A sorting domain-containing protein [Prolixibacteraceae bacterium]|nr:T9SS type A sorting domain-containing protein [Prolixibacteraceae bacterium]